MFAFVGHQTTNDQQQQHLQSLQRKEASNSEATAGPVHVIISRSLQV